MLFPLILAAAAGLAEPAEGSRGVEIAGAHVGVEILQPVIVRQSSGWEQADESAPRPQVSLRQGAVLLEFQ